MERAQNSDSKAHVGKLIRTSRTDFSGKSLCCLFGSPCRKQESILSFYLFVTDLKLDGHKMMVLLGKAGPKCWSYLLNLSQTTPSEAEDEEGWELGVYTEIR